MRSPNGQVCAITGGSPLPCCWLPCVSGGHASPRIREPQSVALPALAKPTIRDPGQGALRRKASCQARSAHHRLLRQRLPGRRHGAADQRPDLAGDAAFAQRNWGIRSLVSVPRAAGRPGAEDRLARLLVGDMSQPRGGPMITPRQPPSRPRLRHLAHPHADRELTRVEREESSAIMVLQRTVKMRPEDLDSAHLNVIKAAAKDPEVARIFVNAGSRRPVP